MSKRLSTIALIIAVSIVVFACDLSKPSSGVPSFIEVGKVYFIYTSVGFQFSVKVVKIENNGWILAESAENTDYARKGELIWVNTAQVPFLKEKK